ncbi:MAG TPA: tRNA pseudouridine(38-40) synthase TruA [Solirubrobacteraceae bacterium]|jgi:tRNA pseudouridine38-40 synthase|nr:tRNA pseudouridine(38-40) synthase TruA [Solirubrobacteraceae bacterium]
MTTKLTLEYDGTGFAGWARQPGKRTVQVELERALHTVLGESGEDGQPLRLTVAGRTDAGVHGWGQVASYQHEAVDPNRLNGLLGKDVAILACEPAPDGFDARRDATSRTYCYRVLARRARSAFERDRAFWVSGPVDRDALSECARALVGKHDFTAFTPSETEHAWFNCRVARAEWIAAGDVLEFWIESDMFLRHMNRVLVGTMLDVAGGRTSLEAFAALLSGRPRSHAGSTAPAHGLALASVSYEGVPRDPARAAGQDRV